MRDSAAHRHSGRLLAVLLSGLAMTNVDITIVNVAVPSIRADLGASGAQLELVVGGYVLTYAMLLITGARLGQMRGYRRVFMVGLGAFTLASLACGLAPGPLALIVARVIQGAGAALLVPQVLTGIQLNFEGAARARALALYAAALAGAAVVGQILGGILVSVDVLGESWRPIFLVNLPIAVGVAVGAVRWLPADGKVETSRRIDVRGVASLSVALLLAVLPLVLGREQGWPLWTWASLGASVPAFAAFLLVERRVAAGGDAPLIDLRTLARPTVSWALLSYAMLTSTYFALLFTLALYLQRGLGWSPLVSGLMLVSWVAAFGLGAPVRRRLPDRAARLGPVVGDAVLCLAYVAISASLFAHAHDQVLLIALLGLGGLGLGAAFHATIGHVTAVVEPRHAADISGVFTTAAQLSGVVGVATFGTAYLALASGSGADHATRAFAIVTAAFAAATLLATPLAYGSIRRAR